jgi:hypothetical protein
MPRNNAISVQLLAWMAVVGAMALCGVASAQVQYTLGQTEAHLNSLLSSPYVQPTPRAIAYDAGQDGLADMGIDSFVVGVTPGTAGAGYTWTDASGTTMDVPSLNLYSYRLTDFSVTAPKTKVVITGGNHADEQHSLYVLQGMVDFMDSSDPAAQQLRAMADIYVYPQVNPEGNWAPDAGKSSGVAQQPSHPNLDHNRYWDDPATPVGTYDLPWAETVILTDAMVADTGATDVGYVFDFHTPGPTQSGTSFIYADSASAGSDFGTQILDTGNFTITTSNPDQGMVRGWGTSPSGLNATYGFTPEIRRQGDDDPPLYESLGEDLARALSTAIVGDPGPGPQDDPPAVGQSLLVDFNNRLTPAVGNWNVIDAEYNSGGTVGLVASDGAVTSAELVLPTILDSGSDGWDQGTNDVPAWAVLEAADDYSYFQGDSVFLLTGLGEGQEYELELIASRNLDRNTIVNISGQAFAWNDLDAYVNGDTLFLESVFADDLGRIAIDFDVAGTSGAINALRLTAVPEPATLGLLALGGLAMLRRRRKA